MAATVTLLYQPFTTRIEALELDAVVREEHTADVAVTEHPVEQGASVADHARLKGFALTIEGVVTATPLPGRPANRAASAEGYSRLSDAPAPRTREVSAGMHSWSTTSVSDSPRALTGRPESAYAALLDLAESPRLVTIATEMRSWEDMVLESLKIPRDAKTGESLRFTATFKRVRIVETGRTVVATKVPAAKPKRNVGTQAPVAQREQRYAATEEGRKALERYSQYLTSG